MAVLPSRLRDMKGGDDARFNALMGQMEAKMVSRVPPGDSLALIQAVLAAHGTVISEDPTVQQPMPPKQGQVRAVCLEMALLHATLICPRCMLLCFSMPCPAQFCMSERQTLTFLRMDVCAGQSQGQCWICKGTGTAAEGDRAAATPPDASCSSTGCGIQAATPLADVRLECWQHCSQRNPELLPSAARAAALSAYAAA
jgi:hypothetical protein